MNLSYTQTHTIRPSLFPLNEYTQLSESRLNIHILFYIEILNTMGKKRQREIDREHTIGMHKAKHFAIAILQSVMQMQQKYYVYKVTLIQKKKKQNK